MTRYARVQRMSRRPLQGFLPDRLRELRIERDLSQGELALRAEVSTAAISAWEVGRSTPNVDKLLAVVAALAVEGAHRGLSTVTMADLISIPEDARTLRNLREVIGKTQPQLAAEIGVSTGLLAALERGHAGLSERVASSVAAALGIPVEDVTAAYERGRRRPIK